MRSAMSSEQIEYATTKISDKIQAFDYQNILEKKIEKG